MILPGTALLSLLAVALLAGSAQLRPVAATQTSEPSTTTPAPAIAPAPAPAPVPVQKQFVIVLDPAHGGDDTGARLSDQVLEKNIVLSLSYRLRSLLAARGFTVITTRDSDTGNIPTNDQRAEIANHANAMACLLLHATATGNGIHLFNSSLAPAPAPQSSARFQPWDAAQAAYIQQSLQFTGELHSALDRSGIPVLLGRTFLRPLDNLTCPAVAVEVAPLAATGNSSAASPADAAYQQRIAEAIAWALVDWRSHSGGGQP
jgi:N-acetylmuramoyl-L-alanine amidase